MERRQISSLRSMEMEGRGTERGISSDSYDESGSVKPQDESGCMMNGMHRLPPCRNLAHE